MSCAAPLSNEIANDILKRLNIKIKQAYGMTETTLMCCYVPKKEVILGFSGVLAPNMSAKLITAEGKDVGYNQEGQLLLRGPNIMKGLVVNL